MAKLYFYYSTMNAGKSTALLQAAYNYAERGMRWMNYSKLVYGWLVLNKTPHTDWDLA